MAQNVVERTLSSVPRVRTDRNYWFVRTNSGDYYSEFLKQNLIAINWNYITVARIRAFADGKILKDELVPLIIDNEGETARPGYVLNQIQDFVVNMREGDVVIVPSESSDTFSIGRLADSEILQVKTSEKSAIPYEKRRRVTWIEKDIPYRKLDPYLFKLKYLQKTITHLDTAETAQAIDRSIGLLFIKDENAHFIIRVTNEDPISTFDLCSVMTGLLDLSEDISNDLGVSFDKEEIDGKFNVQSPGTIELISGSFAGLMIFAAVTGVLFGIEFEGKILGISTKFKTKGLVASVQDALTKSQNRKVVEELKKKIPKIKMNASDIAEIIKSLNGKDNESNS